MSDQANQAQRSASSDAVSGRDKSRSHREWFVSAPKYTGVSKELRSLGTSGITLLQYRQPPGYYKRPGADELTLQLMESGGFHAAVDHGSRYRCKPVISGELALSPSQTDLSYEVDGELSGLTAVIPSRCVQVALQSDEAVSWTGDFGRLHASQFSDDAIRSLLRRAWQEAGAGSPQGALFIDSVWITIAALLQLAAAGRSERASPARGGLARWQLKRTCEAMDAHLDGEIGLNALAQIAGCSPTHFSRAFRQSMGVPPFAWLLQRRVERAKSLLADPRVPLAEVALAVGFSAQPQFTTAFKRVTGVTPGAWRRERLA